MNSLPNLSAKLAWGYHTEESLAKAFPEDGRVSMGKAVAWLNNGMNGASVLLSPVIGIIRMIGAIIALNKVDSKMPYAEIPQSGEEYVMNVANKGAKRYFKMQIARGALELVGLGVILGTVVDGVATVYHQKHKA